MAKTKPGKKDLDSYTIEGTSKVVQVGDVVLLRPQDNKTPPYVARIEKIQEDHRSNVRCRVRWYYRPEEAKGGRRPFHGSKELFLSDHYDFQSALSIEGKCIVHSFKDYKKLDNVRSEDYFCRFEYKAATGAFTPDRIAVYCKCEMPYNPDDLMIQCDECKDWFHPSCVGMTTQQAKKMDHFRCIDCSSDQDDGERSQNTETKVVSLRSLTLNPKDLRPRLSEKIILEAIALHGSSSASGASGTTSGSNPVPLAVARDPDVLTSFTRTSDTPVHDVGPTEEDPLAYQRSIDEALRSVRESSARDAAEETVADVSEDPDLNASPITGDQFRGEEEFANIARAAEPDIWDEMVSETDVLASQEDSITVALDSSWLDDAKAAFQETLDRERDELIARRAREEAELIAAVQATESAIWDDMTSEVNEIASQEESMQAATTDLLKKAVTAAEIVAKAAATTVATQGSEKIDMLAPPTNDIPSTLSKKRPGSSTAFFTRKKRAVSRKSSIRPYPVVLQATQSAPLDSRAVEPMETDRLVPEETAQGKTATEGGAPPTFVPSTGDDAQETLETARQAEPPAREITGPALSAPRTTTIGQPSYPRIEHSDSIHSIPGCNIPEDSTADGPERREGKESVSDFHPHTAYGEKITLNSDWRDPAVIEGVLDAFLLPDPEAEPTDLKTKMRNCMMGGFDMFTCFMEAKKVIDSLPCDAEEVGDIIKDSERVKDYCMELENKLAESRRAQDLSRRTIDTLRAQAALHSYRTSPTRVERLEREIGEQKVLIAKLQQNARQDHEVICNHMEARVAIQFENDDLKAQMKKYQETHSADEQRYQAILALLGTLRKRFNEMTSEKATLINSNAALDMRVRTQESLEIKCKLLEQQVQALTDKVAENSTTLANILASSQRVDPNLQGPEALAAENLALRAWQAEEIILRQNLSETRDELPKLILEKLSEFQKSLDDKAKKENQHAWELGHLAGLEDGRVNAIAERFALSGLNTEINKFLDNMIAALNGDNDERRLEMLKELRLARDAANSGASSSIFSLP